MMNVEQSIKRFGLIPDVIDLNQIREILISEIEKESYKQGLGDTEFIKLCCIQLFSKRDLNDVLLIWRAKTASMDSDCSIDIQLLCGAGLNETKSYLQSHLSNDAQTALSRILEYEVAGEFDDFSVEEQMRFYQSYFEEVEFDSGR